MHGPGWAATPACLPCPTTAPYRDWQQQQRTVAQQGRAFGSRIQSSRGHQGSSGKLGMLPAKGGAQPGPTPHHGTHPLRHLRIQRRLSSQQGAGPGLQLSAASWAAIGTTQGSNIGAVLLPATKAGRGKAVSVHWAPAAVVVRAHKSERSTLVKGQ